MYEIRHRIGVEASLGAVYEHIATTDGLRQWWTTDARGQSTVGDKVSFHFGEKGFMTMEVIELDTDRRVAWRCIEGPEEWIDTIVSFDVRDLAGETILNFAHAGWREPVEFMGHCSSKWGSYLLSLKQGLETGVARPFPNDVKMSRFD